MRLRTTFTENPATGFLSLLQHMPCHVPKVFFYSIYKSKLKSAILILKAALGA